MKKMSNREALDLLQEISEKGKKGKVPALPSKNASFEERMKHSLCRLFVMFLVKSKKQAKDLEAITKIPKTRLSDILNYKTDSYKVDRLLAYAHKLAEIDPATREHLNFMFEVLEGPVRSVSATKKLEKQLLYV